MDALKMIQELRQIQFSLSQDTDRCGLVFQDLDALAKLPADEQIFWFRTLVRSFFAQVEASMYMLKQTSIISGEAYQYPFTEKDHNNINERITKVKKGKTSSHFVRLSLKENIRFSFGIFTKVHGINFDVEADKDGWDAFLKAIDIRNRLMHPRSLSDIYPLDRVDDVVLASQWFKSQLDTVMRQSHAVVESKILPKYS